MISNLDFERIAALDLDSIKMKLTHEQSGEGWSLEHANAIETEYRRFLYLMKAFPTEQTAPLEDVDTFWHYHILDTMKYARDCEEVFGYFLHHYPYLGMVGENGLEVLEQAGDRTRELYESTFGEAYVREYGADAAWCGRAPVEAEGASAKAAWCGRAPEAAMQTAWCGRAPAKVGAGTTAWCGRAPEATAADGARAAWCGRAPVKADGAQTAWCGRAPVKAEGMKTAWCGRAPEKLAADGARTAWCGRAPVKVEAAQTAWCGRAPVTAEVAEAAAVQTAWCGRAPALALAA